MQVFQRVISTHIQRLYAPIFTILDFHDQGLAHAYHI